MELGQLRALRELGDRGSIAAVAAALHVTPSSVSQQISALQRRSGAPLTYKDGRRTALTDAGRALALAVVDVEVALERASQAVVRFQGNAEGTVRVAAFHSAAQALFGPLLSRMNTAGQPILELSDFDVAQQDFPALTQDHDLVIAHRLAGSPPWPGSVRIDAILYEPLDLVVSREHRLAGQESADPEDLRGESWVAVHHGFPLESAIQQIAGVAGSEARISHRINEFSVAATVVAASGAVALMPRYTTDMRHHPDLVLLPITRFAPGRQIDALARPETMERANVKTVLVHLKSIAGGLAGADQPTTE